LRGSIQRKISRRELSIEEFVNHGVLIGAVGDHAGEIAQLGVNGRYENFWPATAA